MKRILWVSFFLNILLALGYVGVIQRLGGWRFAMHRLRHNEAGLYDHRRTLFETLPVKPGAIVFLGDSQIEQCEWSELMVIDSLAVLNRGITGDHVVGVRERLPEILRHRPSQLWLLVGVNDLLFGRNVAEIGRDYRALVQTIRRERRETDLILLGLPPVNNQIKKTGISNTDIQALNEELARIAKEYALPFVDLHAPLSDAVGQLDARFTEDGLHLNGAGYKQWKRIMANDKW